MVFSKDGNMFLNAQVPTSSGIPSLIQTSLSKKLIEIGLIMILKKMKFNFEHDELYFHYTCITDIFLCLLFLTIGIAVININSYFISI